VRLRISRGISIDVYSRPVFGPRAGQKGLKRDQQVIDSAIGSFCYIFEHVSALYVVQEGWWRFGLVEKRGRGLTGRRGSRASQLRRTVAGLSLVVLNWKFS